jgi:peptidoglycan/LPS O-acetylase OafA/YrhL
LTLVVLVALALSFRERIALALVVAVFLALSHRKGRASSNLESPPSRVRHVIRLLGQSSYALFLVHFSVLMLSNAGFAQWQAHYGSGLGAGNSVVLFWLAGLVLSLLAGVGFHRWVEVPLSRLRMGSS